MGRRRAPEKRVTARSNAPQKKCTGLLLPMKRPRNCLKYPVDLHQRPPEAMDVGRVVGGMHMVLVERNGVDHFVRHRMDRDVKIELPACESSW